MKISLALTWKDVSVLRLCTFTLVPCEVVYALTDAQGAYARPFAIQLPARIVLSKIVGTNRRDQKKIVGFDSFKSKVTNNLNFGHNRRIY